MPIPFPQPNEPKRPSSPPYPSFPPSETSSDREEEAAMIQEEWEESLRQIEVVLSIIILPVFGKWWGRRGAFWLWARYEQVGWTRAFFGLR